MLRMTHTQVHESRKDADYLRTLETIVLNMLRVLCLVLQQACRLRYRQKNGAIRELNTGPPLP